MNTAIRVISKISILFPLSVCTTYVIAIGLVPSAIDYFSQNAATSLENSPENLPQQRDTFVPQPNHLPLFTRGSGTR